MSSEIRSSSQALVRRVFKHPFTPLLILILAAVVRFWRLDFHSFWFDEAVSLRWATSDISFIWEKTFPLIEEKHPPAYYMLLHAWLRLLEWFGLHQADAAIRGLGAGLGVLSVWAAMRLAGHLGGPGTGLLTGLLVALSPLLVWYSQETRMFQPATTGILLGALGLYSAWHSASFEQMSCGECASAREMRIRRGAWWLLMVAGLIFALYSYLFSAFVLPAAGLTLLLLYYLHPNRRMLVEGLIALAVVAAVFLPLAQNAWAVNTAESTPGRAFENFVDNHLRLLQVFTVWRVTWPSWLLNAVLLLWGVLLLVGLLPKNTAHLSSRCAFAAAKAAPASAGPNDHVNMDAIEDANERRVSRYIGSGNLAAYWLWLWLGLPLLIANVLLSRSSSIFDEDRYLLFLAPFALWAVARGIVWTAQRVRPAAPIAAVIIVLTLVAALPQVWLQENYRENWRAAAQYIIDYHQATPELSAAVVSHIEYTNLPLQWYLRQTLSHEEMPVFFPFGGWIDPARIEEDVAPPLRGIEDLGVDTLWLVQAHLQHVDPDRHVEGWLQSTYPIVTELHPTGINVTGHMLRYEYDQLPVSNSSPANTPGEPTSESINVIPGLTLHHCRTIFEPIAARDATYHPPSGWVHIQTWWSKNEETWQDNPADLTLAARVLAPGAIWGESLERPADLFRVQPPAAWTPDAIMRAELDINLNPQTPAGIYDIEVRVEKEGKEYSAPCGEVEILDATR